MSSQTQSQTQSKSADLLSATSNEERQRKTQQMDKVKLDHLLRKTRSKQYMEALAQLDAGGHVQNRAQVDEIIRRIQEEFPEIELSGILLGIVSVCYLGVPFEVHTLDFVGGIITHYKRGVPLPLGMEKARTLAMRGGYAFIEVYEDCCRAVTASGSVAVIKC